MPMSGVPTRDAWGQATALIANQLAHRFGAAVRVQYVDFLDPSSPPLAPRAQLRAVLIDLVLFSSGGKLSVPAIAARLELLGRPRGIDDTGQ